MNNEPDGTAREGRELHFAIYDRLPPGLRRLLANAPYNYAVKKYPLAIKKYGVEAVYRGQIAFFFADRDKMIKKIYGKEHPQYRQRPPGYEWTLTPVKPKGSTKGRTGGSSA